MKVYQNNGFLVIETATGVKRMYSRQRGGIFSIQQQGNYVSMYIMKGGANDNEVIIKSTAYTNILDSNGAAAGANIAAVVTYLQNLTIET